MSTVLQVIIVFLLVGQQQILGQTVALAPPLDVKATHQSSSPDQIEVSWTPSPSWTTGAGDSNITEYRIFFESGENVSVPSIVTSVGLLIDGVTIGQQISIRSEATNDLPPSELVNVTVTMITGGRSSVNGAAIALGVVLLVVVLISVVPVILLLYLLQRMHKLQLSPHSCDKFRKHTIIRDPKTSDNIAYGSVNITSLNGVEFQTLIGSQDDECVGEDQPHPAYETVHYNQLVD